MLSKLIRTPQGRTRRTRSDERGQIYIIVGLAAIMLFAIVGLAVDVGRMFVAKAELSRAVDAAALAGVVELPNLTNAENKALAYLLANEPNASPDIVPDASNNALTVDATKTVNFYFIQVLGIDSTTVKAHAKAGFGVAYADSVMVIDSTPSMAGQDLVNAKQAAINFKETLLGSSPNGRTVVGVAPFRGCYYPSLNKSDCINVATQVTQLTSDSSLLTTNINAISTGGSSATNVCTGVAQGWNVLQGPNNHSVEDNSTRYLVILSDGDNYYAGDYTYQASPESPDGATIGGTYYSCAPPVSCTESGYNVGQSTSSSNPCISQVYTPAYTVAEDNFDGPYSNCPSNWSSGSGWVASSSWSLSGYSPTYSTSDSPYDTNCHVHVSSNGAICRAVSLSGLSTASVTYYAKNSSWEYSDYAYLQVSTSGCSSGFTNLYQHTTSNTNGYYSSYTQSLDSYAGQVVYLRFQGSMDSTTGDHFWVDNIQVRSGNSGSQNGYVNGNDASNPVSCTETNTRRERQLDIRTYELAEAVKDNDVEIYVVAFGACNGSDSTIYSDAQCDTQIGNTDSEQVANHRLLKCMASSKDGTNDHYFWAASSGDLPSIFTQIARQIAHRLIE